MPASHVTARPGRVTDAGDGYFRGVAGGRSPRGAVAHQRARSRRGRFRAHAIGNVITYAVWSSYLGAGFAVAASNGYLDHLSRFSSIIVAVAAVVGWPLVFIE